jgi:hypothetical protein
VIAHIGRNAADELARVAFAPLTAEPAHNPRSSIHGESKMAGASDLAKLVPGFEFMQGLMQNAGASLPGMSAWITPTLNPEELDKRIQELKTVQFWLEQNARLLATTIQALEVQRMTLSTLQSMNLPMADLRDALKINLTTSAAPAPVALRPPAQAPAPAPEQAPDEAGTAKPAVVDPMQWWGALTQQFTTLAAQAVKDSAADAARAMAASAAPRAASPATPKTAARPGAKPAARRAKAGPPRKRAG